MPASLSAARRSTALPSSNSAFSFSRLSYSPPGVRNRQERRGTYLTRKWNQSRLLQDYFDLIFDSLKDAEPRFGPAKSSPTSPDVLGELASLSSTAPTVMVVPPSASSFTSTLEVFSPMFHRWTAGGRQDRVLSHDAAATLIWSSKELVGLKGCFPTRPEDSVEMSTAKGTSSGSIEEGGEKKKFRVRGSLVLVSIPEIEIRISSFRTKNKVRMMPELELVESLLVTDVGAFSALVGVATLGAFGLRKQLSDDVIVRPLFILHPASGLPTCNWYAVRQVFILRGLEYALPFPNVSKKEIFRKIR
ncbi:hypothetical protein Lal_00038446 [Lupinus albus]|nr:hypothetical protein Lal_00038446 [Lupinus albus]